MKQQESQKPLYTKPELQDLGSIKRNTGWGLRYITFTDWLTDWSWTRGW